MAIAHVQRVGSNISAAATTTLAVVVPAGGCARGNKLLVAFASNSAGADALPTVADSKGNVYSQVLDYTMITNGNKRLTLFQSDLSVALVSGDTITVTSPSLNKREVQIREVSGLSAGSDKVQATDSQTTFGSTTAGPTSTATAARSVADEFVWGVCAWGGTVTGDVFTAGASYLDAFQVQADDGATVFRYLATEYRIFAVGGTDVANGTLSAARGWIMAAVTFAIAAAAGGAVAREAHVSEITDIATI